MALKLTACLVFILSLSILSFFFSSPLLVSPHLNMINLVESKALYHHEINITHACLLLLIIFLFFFLSLPFPSFLSHNLFVSILSLAKYKYNGYVTSRKFYLVFHILPLFHSSISLHLICLTCFFNFNYCFCQHPNPKLLHSQSAVLGVLW